MIKDKLAIAVSALTIMGIVYAGYSKLATKRDLQRAAIVQNFKWSESNIKINELQLDNLDRIKTIRALTDGEKRRYKSISSSTERIVKAQEALLDAQIVTN